jgi:YD repeat-containing protein
MRIKLYNEPQESVMSRMIYWVLLLIVPMLAQAGVNPKNGNFYISYTDAVLTAQGYKLEMDRTYNSKSGHIGWFGAGWGSQFETHLTVLPDHTAAIVENGAGATSYYHDESRPRDAKRVAAGVARIVAAAKAKDKLSKQAVKDLTQKLLGDEEDRLTAVNKYQVQSTLPRKLKLTAYGGGYCAGTLQRTAAGYERDDSCGRVEEFDPKGNLLSRKQDLTEDGYLLTLRYEHGHPVEIKDQDGRGFNLSWSSEGFVNRLVASDGTVVEYEYDDKHNLIQSNALAGTYKGESFGYDYDRRHNMTRIRYLEGTSMFITYDDKDNVTRMDQTNGEHTLYEYLVEEKKPETYSTRIRQFDQAGKESSQTIGFQTSKSATGESRLDGYSLQDQESLRAETKTELDEKGRMLSKTYRSGDVLSYTYHPTLEKIASVKLNGKLRATFKYNDKGDLIHAEDADGKAVDLEYDDQKHISRMVTTDEEGKRGKLDFIYGANGKPVKISDEQGSIDVTYDDTGEISNVESAAGPAMALRVATMFQNMLHIVNLAKSGD